MLSMQIEIMSCKHTEALSRIVANIKFNFRIIAIMTLHISCEVTIFIEVVSIHRKKRERIRVKLKGSLMY